MYVYCCTDNRQFRFVKTEFIIHETITGYIPIVLHIFHFISKLTFKEYEYLV